MTREQIEAWVQDLGAYVEQQREIDKQLSQAKASINIAQELGDVKQVEGFVQRYEQLKKVRLAIEAGATRMANVADMAAVERLLIHIVARLKATARIEEQLVDVESQVEFSLATVQREPDQAQEAFDEAYTAMRVQAEKVLDTTRKRLQSQLVLAEQLVPNKAVVLSG